MSAELSAFAAYGISKRPKKSPKKNTKQVSKKGRRNNGAGYKRQNGVQKHNKEANRSKMSSTENSSSSGGNCGSSSFSSADYSGSSGDCNGSSSTNSSLNNITNESTDELETTADLAYQMAAHLKNNCGNGNCEETDEDASSDADSDEEASSDADSDEDAGSDADSDDDGDSESDSASESAAGNSNESAASNQFSEYTLNSHASSSESSPVAVPMPATKRKAAKRAELSTEAATDTNNNDNNKPLPPKQRKLIQQQQQGLVGKAMSCPLVRVTAAAARLAANAGVVKSCPLPKKQPQKAASSVLPAKNPQLDKMAARKSEPLPKQQPQQQQQQKANGRRTLHEVAVAATAPSSSKDAPQPARKEVQLQHSKDEGKRVLFWLLNPITPETFFSTYWEKNACQVQRNRAQYFSQLISFKMIDEMLIKNHLEFTTNIDVTSYQQGERQTHNPDGRAMPPTVWGFYGEGCSIRILNPSTYLSGLRQVCTVLQEYFHCLVGANVYLTPPNSQGFAPHYDDIEAFVLQVEGRKRWRLYAPPQPSDVLARTSSGNYKQEQLGEPIYDAVLEPGDILYFPRGTVHQAVTEEQKHSLHITLSVYQQQSFANLMEELMPAVVQRAIKHHLRLRRGLPLDTWQHLGLAHGAQKTEQRAKLIAGVKQLVQQYLMPSDAQIDAAVDQLAKRFQHEALPPVILPEEKIRTVFGSRSQTDAQGNCLADYELTEGTKVRLLRANVLRLVAEGTSLRVYYYVDNALEYCKYEANFMEIQPTEAAAVEALITAYPNYIKVANLPLRSADRRIEVATALWEHGLLMTEKPFK